MDDLDDLNLESTFDLCDSNAWLCLTLYVNSMSVLITQVNTIYLAKKFISFSQCINPSLNISPNDNDQHLLFC